MAWKRFYAAIRHPKKYIMETEWTKGKKVALILLAATVISVLFLSTGNRGETEAVVVKRQNYSEKIAAVGQLQLARETTLVSEVSGDIQFIGAEEGDYVTAGSLIISINDSGQEFLLQQKKAEYESAEAQLRNLAEFDYPAANAELISQSKKKEKAQKAYEAALELYEQGAISQIDFLQYQAEYEAASAAWNTAKLKVDSLGKGGALYNSADSQLQRAQSIYENALNDREKYQITVPWNAILLKAYVSENDNVRSGDLLAEIGESGSYHVITELDEKYFPYLSAGMRASISMDGEMKHGGTEGKVVGITPKINSETGTFQVKIALPDQSPYQASDLTVNVEILIREWEDALVIPEEYLNIQDSSIYLYQNGRAVKTSVKYEAGPSSNILIIDGLREGDIVLKPDAGIQNGQKVWISKGVEAS